MYKTKKTNAPEAPDAWGEGYIVPLHKKGSI